MSDKLTASDEQVSALVDGQLHDAEFVQAVKHLEASSDARDAWDTYHLIGDVLRSGQAPVRAHDAEFVDRLRLRMAAENTKLIAADALSIRAGGLKTSQVVSANDAGWKRVAGLLSIVAVGIVAWQGFQYLGSGVNGLSSGAPQVAQVSTPPAGAVAFAGASEPLMLRDPRLDALLAAHRQFGGTSALQMPSGFLRNATFEEGNR